MRKVCQSTKDGLNLHGYLVEPEAVSDAPNTVVGSEGILNGGMLSSNDGSLASSTSLKKGRWKRWACEGGCCPICLKKVETTFNALWFCPELRFLRFFYCVDEGVSWLDSSSFFLDFLIDCSKTSSVGEFETLAFYGGGCGREGTRQFMVVY
ncbi:hypothetical protein QYF36_022630 [Acer negundo]|nr:hypothetical protein QYF36_022630 [Acer negundo]